MRTIGELYQLDTFEERFDYLSLRGRVGEATFGFERYMNQNFYTSTQWRHVRQQVLARDLGCDLGVEGFEIFQRAEIHHMNPMTPEDLHEDNPDILDPRYLITTTHKTHNAIHYGGDVDSLYPKIVERTPGDTTLWPQRRN